MLDIKFIRQNTDTVRAGLENRGSRIDLDRLLDFDSSRRSLIQKVDKLKAGKNAFSSRIAAAKTDDNDLEEKKARMRDISETIKSIDTQTREIDEQINEIVMAIPNMPHASVPAGKDEGSNLEIRRWGKIQGPSFDPKPHWDIGEGLGILDFKRAAKISGARFCLSLGAGARMERALINLMMDIHTSEHGYTEVLPPFMVNRESMTATGQLPKFEEDLYATNGWFLIPTAEVPLTNIYRAETIPAELLPIKLVAYTPCFRKEAGSYGKDTRGLIRQHQFNKVEMVQFTRPEDSYEGLEALTLDAEAILQRLELPYRVVSLCTGDLGFSAAKTYDLEVWMPAQGVFREISSCSNFEGFQARRGKIRMKTQGEKKTRFCHTLNGSGLAVGRTVAAILENYQIEDGSVRIPEALRPYMGLDLIAPMR
ncbi:MAG: serine--tRNA ligase [Thermodesulfobacteriota bacterium]|nr:serine--tRNA ligase [Thermodesulfobacteriota bacterium]